MRSILLLSAALLCGPAAAQAPHGHGDMAALPPPGLVPSNAAFEAALAKMQHDMDIPYTGDADRDFAASMVPHGQGALDMAKVELQYGRDPQMRKLAQDIIASQQAEIAMLRQWLAARSK